LQNSLKHKSTPLTNHMGLPTLVSYSPFHVARKMKNDRVEDPFGDWKKMRREILSERAPLYWGMVLLLFGIIAYVSRGLKDWEVTALSTAFIFALFELTCYYYNFLIILAPLTLRRFRHVVALLVVVILSQFFSLVIGWFDERHLAQSLLVALLYGYILFDLVQERRKGLAPEADGAPDIPDSDADDRPAVSADTVAIKG